MRAPACYMGKCVAVQEYKPLKTMRLHLNKTLHSVLLALFGLGMVQAAVTTETVNGATYTNVGFGNTTQTISGDLTVNSGDKVGAFDANNKLVTSFGTPTNSLTVTGNVYINGTGQIALGGQNSSKYMGLQAKTVTVDADSSSGVNLISTMANIETLHLKSGRVELHGSYTSGNSYITFSNEKQAKITKELILDGGYLSMGTTGAQLNESHFMNVFASGFLSKGSAITQRAGTMNVYGYSLTNKGFSITQTGGTMNFRDTLKINNAGSGTTSIVQDGDQNTKLTIGNLQCASSSIAINVTQRGAGTIELQKTTNGVYNISQEGTGKLILKENSGAVINIEQTNGNSTVELGAGASCSTDSLSLNTTGSSEAAMSVSGSLTLSDAASLNFTMDSMDVPALEMAATGDLAFEGGAEVVLIFGDTLRQQMQTEATIEGARYTIDLITNLSDADVQELKSLVESDSLTLTLVDNSVATFSLLRRATTESVSIESLGLSVDEESGKLQANVLVTAVPEPATATLSLLSLAALAARRRRR